MDGCTGRSLVCLPLATVEETDVQKVRAPRPDPRFLAHLISVRSQLPAHRAKRRAAPDEGAAAYRKSLCPEKPKSGTVKLDTQA